jgi:hypothetical protein
VAQQTANLALPGHQAVLGGHPGRQGRQGRGNVPLHIHRHLVIGVHHGREAVQVDDLLLPAGVDPGGREFLQFVAHADNDIRLIKAGVHVVVHHEAHGPQGVGVIVGKDAFAVKGGGHRNPEALGKLDQGRLGLLAGRAVAGQDDGGGRGLQHLGRQGDLVGRRGLGVHRMHRQRLQPGGHRHGGHVLGDGQIDSPGALSLGQIEGVAHHFRRSRGGEQGVGPLGHRLEHGHQVHRLVGLLVDAPQAHLGADGHQGRAVGLGVGHSQEQVDGSGAQGGETDPGFPRHPAVEVRHEGGRLFRAGQNKAQGSLAEGIHQVDDLFAGETEDIGHPFVLQAPGQQLGDVHFP